MITVKGRKIYESVGKFVRNFLCSVMMACFEASAACLSSREVVIKVCCKTCRIKTVGEADLGSVSGLCAVRDYGLETIYIDYFWC